MIVQAASFVPLFVLGLIFLLGPSFVVVLFTNSDHVSALVALATAIAALVRPQASWMLVAVLCTLRTLPFIGAFIVAIFLKIGVAGAGGWMLMAILLTLGGIAQLRIRALRRSGEIDI